VILQVESVQGQVQLIGRGNSVKNTTELPLPISLIHNGDDAPQNRLNILLIK